MLKRKKKQIKMAELVRRMKKLEQQVARCSRCGICQSVCPLYNVTQNESDVARGKLMLIDGLMRSFFDDPEGVWQRLDRCLLCGSCAANCPRHVNGVEIFLNARVVIAGYRRMPLVKKIIFRNILLNPDFFDRVMSFTAKWQGLFFRKTNFKLNASCAAMVSLPFSDRKMLPLAPVPFHKISQGLLSELKASPEPALEKSNKTNGINVAFFVGCLLDKVFPKVAADILRILHFHGVQVILPPSQGCCGIPALASGDDRTFNRLVTDNLNHFNPSDYDYLVTGCATCTATIKTIWPALFTDTSDNQKTAVHRVAEKTYDINQFLVNVLKIQLPLMATENESKPVVTWHDPCHLKKTLGVYAEPRQLICANDAYSFVEMPAADACCGMGGSFNLAHYTLSADIGKKKVVSIEKTGAAVVATGCPACMIQLADMLAATGKKIRVAHSAELYSEKILPPDIL